MRELGGSGGKITVAANSPAGDFPIGSTYLFSNDDHQTASDFSGWLREQLESKIDYPLGLTAERMDDATGLATLTLEVVFSAPNGVPAQSQRSYLLRRGSVGWEVHFAYDPAPTSRPPLNRTKFIEGCQLRFSLLAFSFLCPMPFARDEQLPSEPNHIEENHEPRRKKIRCEKSSFSPCNEACTFA